MEIALIIIAIILVIAGIIGDILPALPGVTFSFVGLLITYLACPGQISLLFLLAMLFFTIIVSVIDYIAPAWMTKAGGGSKAAIWGSTIGIFAGLFFMPLGLVLGPFIGAFIGEMYSSERVGHSMKVACMSIVSFLLTTGIKLVLSCIIAARVIYEAVIFCFPDGFSWPTF